MSRNTIKLNIKVRKNRRGTSGTFCCRNVDTIDTFGRYIGGDLSCFCPKLKGFRGGGLLNSHKVDRPLRDSSR